MLRYIYGHDLHRFPKLARSMFEDRADQFHARLGWDVSVDETGQERDGYDAHDPLYAIWQDAAGRHAGSMRFLPTTGPVMINDVFGHLTGGAPIRSPLIWECTRFCLARGASPRVAGALMMAGGEVMANFGIRHLAGVFDARMVRIYRTIGASPEILGSEGEGRSRISVGLWEHSEAAMDRIAHRAGIPRTLSKLWFDRSFGPEARAAMKRTA